MLLPWALKRISALGSTTPREQQQLTRTAQQKLTLFFLLPPEVVSPTTFMKFLMSVPSGSQDDGSNETRMSGILM